MFKLLPELLADQKGGDGAGKQMSWAKGWKRYRKLPSGCWGVVAEFEPDIVPWLVAYMVSIIRASQEYEGAAWVAYDAAFRRQAAATGQRDWARINTSLYTMCFTGKARKSLDVTVVSALPVGQCGLLYLGGTLACLIAALVTCRSAACMPLLAIAVIAVRLVVQSANI